MAKKQGVSVEKLNKALERGKKKLFETRERRIKPDRDEKILTAWNGLMLASFAEAGAILEREDYRSVAKRNAQFVLDNLRRENLLLRTYKEGQAKLNGYLEDYAFLADGLIALYETTGELQWVVEARSIADLMLEEFWDEKEGGFFFTGQSHEELIVRSKDFFDNATPSGNSVAAEVLLHLGALLGNEDYTRKAVNIIRLLSDSIKRYPSAFGRLLGALDFHLSTPKEIAIIGTAESSDTLALKREIWRRYLPNKVVALAAENDEESAAVIPLLRERPMINGAATAYVCESFTCQQPVTTAGDLAEQLTA